MVVPQDSHYSSSKEEILDAPDDITHTEGLITSQLKQDVTALGTKGDIKAQMNNIRAFFNADLVWANEDNVSSIAQQQTGNKDLIQQLQASQKTMLVRMDMLEDTRCHNNLKIGGIAETVDEHEPTPSGYSTAPTFC
ncbi:Hypothetical predicted protein [Pelobates cultripes]|uniref:Uncharacterized protein n=1 Tax=Pelobates cultripes TaxID=61616 RepID=A0AAD1RG63_PELCU|nr:Hypothetical predicted protein [Pelobates cultripes]